MFYLCTSQLCAGERLYELFRYTRLKLCEVSLCARCCQLTPSTSLLPLVVTKLSFYASEASGKHVPCGHQTRNAIFPRQLGPTMSKIGSFYFISFTMDLILIQYSDPCYPSFFFFFVFGQKACTLTANLPVF